MGGFDFILPESQTRELRQIQHNSCWLFNDEREQNLKNIFPSEPLSIIRHVVLQCDHQWKATHRKIVIKNQNKIFSALYSQ